MKIAIAGFQHETNRFAPIETSYDDFVQEDGWPGMTFGQDLWDVFLPANIPLGGFLNFAKDRPDIEVVPILWASAEPAGLVQDEAFDRIADLILDGLEAAMPLDGVYLDLHGAMVFQSFEDGYGELLFTGIRHCGHCAWISGLGYRSNGASMFRLRLFEGNSAGASKPPWTGIAGFRAFVRLDDAPAEGSN